MDVKEDLFFIKKDSTQFQVEIGFTPIETPEGHMVVISIFDITERKIQEATRKNQLILEIKNRELEQFTYVASHDLQEPLRNISGLINLFEKKFMHLFDLDAHEIMATINRSNKRMSMLVKSLLEFSLLGRNTNLTMVDCNIVLSEVIEDLGTMISDYGATLEVGELPKLHAYEFQIRQIFQNLITNAIKFCKEGMKPEIKISSRKHDNKWLFSVKDNGIGILPEHFETIFAAFYRLHSQCTYEGSGIGLTNCKKIAQSHDGEIWVESTYGEGTTIHFTVGDLSPLPNTTSLEKV